MARACLGRMRWHDLDAESLVHESYLQLLERQNLQLTDRSMFYAYVGRMMHSIVVDHVRAKRARKRGGDKQHVALTDEIDVPAGDDKSLPALSTALQKLETVAPRSHDLIAMRYFVGLSLTEIAARRNTSIRTVERDLQKARAALRALMET
jgi:RNA polymerase sigma factor (TIGR02999 family)